MEAGYANAAPRTANVLGQKQKTIGNLSAGTVSDGLNENVDKTFSETNRV
jgi:hypothetical protein